MSHGSTDEAPLATRLYLTAPFSLVERDADAARQLESLCERLDVACVCLELPLAAESDGAALVRRLQEQGVAVLVGIDQIPLMASPGGADMKAFDAQLAIARRLGCDGVHLPADDSLFAPARAGLPADAIIGGACAASRHQAMLFGELGTDYVAFAGPGDAVVDLVAWWQDLFETSSVAWQVGEAETLEALLALPADFIALGPQQWSDKAFIERLESVCGRTAEAS